MEQKPLQLDERSFSCSICLDPLKDPVTTPCGHSFCRDCIERLWDQKDEKKIYSCPQCRRTFTPRPVLEKNNTLAVLLEELEKTGFHSSPTDPRCAGPEDVVCDVCTGMKLKAIKSCLVCLVSYCEEHLQSHYHVAPLKKHKLVEPSKKLQESMCSRHDEVMKMFCRTDQQCICYLCSLEDHKDHDTVSAAAERSERQKDLQVRRLNIQQGIQVREKDLKVLQQEVEAINRSADKAVEESEKVFILTIRLMETRKHKANQKVRSQQDAEVSRVTERQKKLEQEITELKRKDAEGEELSRTEDHTQFLHNYASLSALGGSPPSIRQSTSIRTLRYFEDVTAAGSKVRQRLQDILREKPTNISPAEVLLSRPKPEPKTRAGFLRCSCEITLDPNTVNRHLLLSEGNRKVKSGKGQRYPHHPERFSAWPQVLSREVLTGRCYWEVKWRGEVYVAVAYEKIGRAGCPEECFFGQNDHSWMLRCEKERYQFRYNRTCTQLSAPRSDKVGVFLDHAAGILSFYSVSGDAISLLHRVQTTFTQPLHAGLYLSIGSSAEFCKLGSTGTTRVVVKSGSISCVTLTADGPSIKNDGRYL